MMKHIKSVLHAIFVICVLVLTSCTASNSEFEKLCQLDSLMEADPRASYDSLCHMNKQILASNSKVTMKYRLLTAKAQNKLYLPMPSDSLFCEVVNYYDRHGTSNEKMEAHYLLGCIYRDQKEAPMAIQCYKKAVDCADTLDAKCDYSTLFSIYGQMGEIQEKQYLYKEALKQYEWYSHFALKAGDKYNFIRGKEFVGGVLYSLKDTLRSMKIAKECALLYEKFNMPEDASAALLPVIYNELQLKNYKKARSCMQRFEKQSGMYKDDVLSFGREYYYYLEGLYFLGIDKIDLAECSFRKLMMYEFKFDAYKGMLSVYAIKNNPDSVKKYTILLESSLDKILTDKQTEAVAQATAMYNYSYVQKVAYSNKYKARMFRSILLFLIIIFLGISVCSYMHYKNKMKNKEQMLESKNINYIKVLNELNINKQEIVAIRKNSGLVIKQKEKQIEVLLQKLDEYRIRYQDNKEKEDRFLQLYGDLVDKFRKMATTFPIEYPKNSDWKELEATIKLYLPSLYAMFFKKNVLTSQEIRTSILTYMGFSNSEISILLNVSNQRVTNIKAKVNLKLFGENSASSFYRNLVNV